jgi:uncharacterized SAM-binding protein YcdF (DUF218 family)
VGIVKALFLPPGGLIILGFLGLWVRRKRRPLGTGLIVVALALMYLFSTPLFAAWALRLLSPAYVDPRSHTGVQAIVVLAGGTSGFASEYGGDTVNTLTLMRARYAARLHVLTAKPILVSGGRLAEKTTTDEATQIRALLADEFKVPVSWVEDRSLDTFSNALETRRILAPLAIKKIYVVTHAWHIPRARIAFEHAGFDVVPAPTGFATVEDIGTYDFAPRASALLSSYYFFHEVIGYAWYWIKVRTVGERT